MPLVPLELPPPTTAVPRDVRLFLREADRRIDEFQRDHCIPAFVPSDFPRTYGILRALAEREVAPGRLFCEWGSGFGVVACLAAMLEYDACGIEIERELVEAAQELADDFNLPVQFFHGSLLPPGANARLDPQDSYAWLSTDESDLSEELGLSPEDFQVIYAYPWPGEEHLAEDLFEQFGSVGAILLTYHGGEEFRAQRKTAPSPSTRRAAGQPRRRSVS